MPTSSQPTPEGASWPPTFASCSNYSSDDLVKAIEKESNNGKAPDTYRDFMQHISQELKLERETIQRLTDKANVYSAYVKTIEQTYNTLAEIHNEERKRGDALEEKVLELDEEIKRLQLAAVAKEKWMNDELLRKTNYYSSLHEQHSKIASKQAQGRKNIEEKLIAREMELAELHKKHSETETYLTEKQKEVDKLKTDNQQLLLLVAYLQNPNQMNRQPVQQQHHIQNQPHRYQ